MKKIIFFMMLLICCSFFNAAVADDRDVVNRWPEEFYSIIPDAILSGDYGDLKDSLKLGANPNQRYKGYGITPIDAAVDASMWFGSAKELPTLKSLFQGRTIEVLDILFDAGARIPQGDSYSILYLPIADGQISLLEYLIKKGADVNSVANDGGTPLLLAQKNYQKNKQKEIIKILLRAGTAPLTTTPLLLAQKYNQKNNQKEIIKILLQAGATPLTRAELLQHQLILAVKKNDLSRVKKLIREGAYVNGKSGNAAALHTAIQFPNYNVKTAKFLLGIGADPNQIASSASLEADIPPLCGAVGVSEKTFLHKNQGIDLFNELLKHGAKVDLPDGDNSTPLFYAIGMNNITGVKMLIENGANVMVVNEQGKTPLDKAEDETIIKMLKAAGATKTLDQSDKDNNTSPIN